MLCFKSSKSFGTILCCIPLSPAVIVGSLLFIGWGVWEVFIGIDTANQVGSWDLAAILLVIIASIRILCGVGGIFAVFCHWAGGMGLLTMAYKVVLMSMVLTFIVQWIEWGLLLGGVTTEDKEKWDPTSGDITQMVIFTVLYVAFFAASWYILSVFKSLKTILQSGGSGWEGKNYKKIREEKQDAKKVRRSSRDTADEEDFP